LKKWNLILKALPAQMKLLVMFLVAGCKSAEVLKLATPLFNNKVLTLVVFRKTFHAI